MIRFQDEMQIFIILKFFGLSPETDIFVLKSLFHSGLVQHFHEILKKTELMNNQQ